MSVQSGKFVLPEPEDTTARSGEVRFPGGAYRANLYVYDPFGRIDWYALVPSSFAGGKFFAFGRGPDCNISLNDGAVSTRHAYIAHEGGQLVLRDLQSTNGTFCNGERARERVLAHGDVVRLGATDVRFLYSYRDSPVQLVLDFTQGRNAGRTLATTRASTQIGRLNCAINLQGPDVAAQHVRVDAFGADLLFVVTLQRQRPTLLNGQVISGIVPARAGDKLTVGDHEIVLRVATPEELAQAEPLGDGTLLIKERTDSAKSGDPVLQLSADDLPTQAPTMADEGLDEEAHSFLSPTRPPEEIVPGPTAEMAPETDKIPPEVRWRARQDKSPLRTARRALVLGVLLGAIVGGAALIPVPRQVALKGRLLATTQQPLVATVRGRVAQVARQPGQPVAAGEVVARLVDLDTKAEVERLTAAIAELEREAKTTKAVVRPASVSPALMQRLSAAERGLDQARQRRKAVLSAFNRRELGLSALEEARAKEQAAVRAVDQLRLQIRAQKGRQEVVAQPPDQALLQRIGELVARKEKLAAEQQVTVKAHEAGLLAPVSGQPDLQIGAVVDAGDPLLVVMAVDTLVVNLDLDEAQLDALGDQRMVTVVPRGQPEPRAYQARLEDPVPTGEGTWRVRGHIANPGRLLRPGQGVHIEVDLPAGNMLGLARDWLLGRSGE